MQGIHPENLITDRFHLYIIISASFVALRSHPVGLKHQPGTQGLTTPPTPSLPKSSRREQQTINRALKGSARCGLTLRVDLRLLSPAPSCFLYCWVFSLLFHIALESIHQQKRRPYRYMLKHCFPQPTRGGTKTVLVVIKTQKISNKQVGALLVVLKHET